MALIKKKIDFTKPLSQEQKNSILVASKKPLTIDSDAPELTDDQIKEIKTIIDSRRMDDSIQSLTVHLSKVSMKKIRTWGSDYNDILDRLVDLAINDQELLNKAMHIV